MSRTIASILVVVLAALGQKICRAEYDQTGGITVAPVNIIPSFFTSRIRKAAFGIESDDDDDDDDEGDNDDVDDDGGEVQWNNQGQTYSFGVNPHSFGSTHVHKSSPRTALYRVKKPKEYREDAAYACYASSNCIFAQHQPRYIYNSTTNTCVVEYKCDFAGFENEQECASACIS